MARDDRMCRRTVASAAPPAPANICHHDREKRMPKRTTETLAALLFTTALGGCAWLPPMDAADATDDSPPAADAVYVDYWQTRDPSEYRQRATRPAVTPSPDVVVAQRPAPPVQAKKQARTPDCGDAPSVGEASRSTAQRRSASENSGCHPAKGSQTRTVQSQTHHRSGSREEQK